MVTRVGSNQFSRRLRLQADRFERNAEGVVKKAAGAALEAVLFNTRIDTSKMVSNWIVTRNGPATEVIPAHSVGRKGSTAPQSIATALAYGRAEIEQFSISQDADLFLTNNTPYLRFNDTGMTRQALAAARSVIAGAKLL